jgi:hypothetical protein
MVLLIGVTSDNGELPGPDSISKISGAMHQPSHKAEIEMNIPTIKRWTKISLRTLHILSVAGVGGGILFGLEVDLWHGYWWLAMASGGLMMLIDIVSNPVWVVQVRGLVIFLKLILLAFLGSDPMLDRYLLVVIIIISAIISHAPGKLRYYSVYHHKTILSSNDSKG